MCEWRNFYVFSNNNGVRCIPSYTSGDEGYFTTWEWNNVYISGWNFDAPGYGVLCHPERVGYLLQLNNVAIERCGFVDQSAMALFFNTTVNGNNVYFENSPVPAVNNMFGKLSLANCHFNGTQGITIGTLSDSAFSDTYLNNIRWVEDSDKLFCCTSSESTLVVENCTDDIPTILSAYPDRAVFINSGGYPLWIQKKKSTHGNLGNIRLGAGLSTLDEIICYTKTVTATVPANGAVNLITNGYSVRLWGAGVVGVASITSSYQPDLLLTVTLADTGNANYFCVRARNFSASPIMLTDQQITVTFYTHTGVGI